MSVQQLPQNSHSAASLNNQQYTSLIHWRALDEPDAKTRAFLAVVEWQAQTTTLVSLTSTGLNLFSLVKTIKNTDINKTYMAFDEIKPQVFFDELMMIYLPFKEIQATLPENWQLSEQLLAQKKVRQLMYNGALILSISYDNTAMQPLKKVTLKRFDSSAKTLYQFELRLLEAGEI